MKRKALKVETEVDDDGRVTLRVPFPGGTRVTVFVGHEADGCEALVAAAESSLGFWDNPLDGEEWNAA